MVKKILVAKTTRGTYYVQRMPGMNGLGVRYVLFKDRRQVYWCDYSEETGAISALLELLRRDLVAQAKLRI